MRVDAMEARLRERLGHEDRRVPVSAADIRHGNAGLELLHDAVERREPLREQTRSRGIPIEVAHAVR